MVIRYPNSGKQGCTASTGGMASCHCDMTFCYELLPQAPPPLALALAVTSMLDLFAARAALKQNTKLNDPT